MIDRFQPSAVVESRALGHGTGSGERPEWLRNLTCLKKRLLRQGDPNLRAARQHRSFDAMSGILGWLLSLARTSTTGLPLAGRALEIGTGQFMTHAAGLFLCGFNRVLTVDRYRQLSLPLVRASMQDPVLARRFLSPFASHDQFRERLKRLEATGFDPVRLAATGLEYRAPLDAVELTREPERFDLILSYTVLEHVPPREVPGLLGASSQLLAPGGVALHFVDLEDHLAPGTSPFAFLEPALSWGDDQCGARGNRLRFSRWRRLFVESSDLKWNFPYVAVRHDASLPSMIDPAVSHTDEDDLRTAAFLAVAQAADQP